MFLCSVRQDTHHEGVGFKVVFMVTFFFHQVLELLLTRQQIISTSIANITISDKPYANAGCLLIGRESHAIFKVEMSTRITVEHAEFELYDLILIVGRDTT
jgi:hypothetical protein